MLMVRLRLLAMTVCFDDRARAQPRGCTVPHNRQSRVPEEEPTRLFLKAQVVARHEYDSPRSAIARLRFAGAAP